MYFYVALFGVVYYENQKLSSKVGFVFPAPKF